MTSWTLVIGLFIYTAVSVANSDGDKSFCSDEKTRQHLIPIYGIMATNPFVCSDDNILKLRYGSIYDSVFDQEDQLNSLRCICYNDLMKNNETYMRQRPSSTRQEEIRRERIADMVEQSIEHLAQKIMPQIDLSPATAKEIAGTCSVAKFKDLCGGKVDEGLRKALAGKVKSNLTTEYHADFSVFDSIQMIYAKNFNRNTNHLTDQESCFERPNQFASNQLEMEKRTIELMGGDEGFKEALESGPLKEIAIFLTDTPVFKNKDIENIIKTIEPLVSEKMSLTDIVLHVSRGVGSRGCTPKANKEISRALSQECEATLNRVETLLCGNPDDTYPDNSRDFITKETDPDDENLRDIKRDRFSLYCESKKSKKNPLSAIFPESEFKTIRTSQRDFRVKNENLNKMCKDNKINTNFCVENKDDGICENDQITDFAISVKNVGPTLARIRTIDDLKVSKEGCGQEIESANYGKYLKNAVFKELLGAVEENGVFKVVTYNEANEKIVAEILDSNKVGDKSEVIKVDPGSAQDKQMEIVSAANPEQKSPVSSIKQPEVSDERIDQINKSFAQIARERQAINIANDRLDQRERQASGYEKFVQNLKSQTSQSAFAPKEVDKEKLDELAALTEKLKNAETQEEKDRLAEQYVNSDLARFINDLKAANPGKAAEIDAQIAAVKEQLRTQAANRNQRIINNYNTTSGRIAPAAFVPDESSPLVEPTARESSTTIKPTNNPSQSVASRTKITGPINETPVTSIAEPIRDASTGAISKLSFTVSDIDQDINEESLTLQLVQAVTAAEQGSTLADQIEIEIIDETNKNQTIKIFLTGFLSDEGPKIAKAFDSNGKEIVGDRLKRYEIITDTLDNAFGRTSKAYARRLNPRTLEKIMEAAIPQLEKTNI